MYRPKDKMRQKLYNVLKYIVIDYNVNVPRLDFSLIWSFVQKDQPQFQFLSFPFVIVL